MKPMNEKERNERINKLVDLISRYSVRRGTKDLNDCLSDENWFKRDQTEEDYQKEQEEWLKTVQMKKKGPKTKKKPIV